MNILHRWNDTVLWEGEAGTVGEAVIAALKAGADLTRADLRGADLRGAVLMGADLRGAVLMGADLRGAVLTRADLTGADLRGAVLRGADLRGAVLMGADLRGAVLTGAVLTGADLRGAVLTGADLRGAVLTGADLTSFRDDIWAVLSAAPQEVSALLEKLQQGGVDGSCYEGDCCCLVGTLAAARGVDYRDLCGLVPNSARPAEVWFTLIHPGDTPATSEPCRLAAEWVTDWLARMRTAFGASVAS